MFNGYFDASHKSLFGLTAIKVREHPIDGGIASLAEARWNPRLASEATGFLQQIGYVGPVDIDYAYDADRDEYMVLDVNPRLGAAFRAFVDSRGWDVARVMFADLSGTAVQLGEPLDGRRWLAEHADLAAALRQRRRRLLSLRMYLESLTGVRELAWFALDDPRPLLDLARQAKVKLHPLLTGRPSRDLRDRLRNPDVVKRTEERPE
jgi:predicted ATP-grasp superfamily ATP-dependent carboligase